MKKVIVLGSLNMDLTIQCVDLPKNGEDVYKRQVLSLWRGLPDMSSRVSLNPVGLDA